MLHNGNADRRVVKIVTESLKAVRVGKLMVLYAVGFPLLFCKLAVAAVAGSLLAIRMWKRNAPHLAVA